MIRSPAKCILSGEHSVLKGGHAIVSPLNVFETTLQYQPDLKLELFSKNDTSLRIILDFLRAIKLLPKAFSRDFYITSSIPVSAGLGSSAALCVVIAKLLEKEGYIDSSKIFEVAKNCEDLFHGKSSGVDIAGVLSKKTVLYSLNKTVEFTPLWKPLFYVSYSGIPSQSKESINRVQHYRKSFPKANTDQNMESATQQIYEALLNNDSELGLKQLCEGIKHANHCFEEWGIVNKILKNHQNSLIKAGALATKPTGSGEGGYVLSLWKEPPVSSSIPLISLSL